MLIGSIDDWGWGNLIAIQVYGYGDLGLRFGHMDGLKNVEKTTQTNNYNEQA